MRSQQRLVGGGVVVTAAASLLGLEQEGAG